MTLYFSQLEWAELAPHKVTGKIFGWFRKPGPQRLACDGRPCPSGHEVRRHHCPPDTGHLCADHEAWQPLSPARPSPPTHFPTLSCQKQPRPLALHRAFSGACLRGPQRSFCGPVSSSHQEMSAACPGHSLAPAGSPHGTHPQTSLLQTSALQPPCLCSCHTAHLEHLSHLLPRACSHYDPALHKAFLWPIRQ